MKKIMIREGLCGNSQTYYLLCDLNVFKHEIQMKMFMELKFKLIILNGICLLNIYFVFKYKIPKSRRFSMLINSLLYIHLYIHKAFILYFNNKVELLIQSFYINLFFKNLINSKKCYAALNFIFPVLPVYHSSRGLQF